MRIIPLLLTVLLTGCQGLSPLDRLAAEPVPSVMPFWNIYQQCLTTTDGEILIQSIDRLEHAMLVGSQPPEWMKSWGGHVIGQPLRTTIDPRALSAACTLRTASVMADQSRLTEATALYERVVARYPDADLSYYVERAKDALTALPSAQPALLARR